jgi:methionyl-tRNA formyltransferase
MKILFIGCVESSRQLLESLIECDVEIVGVITKKQSEFNADFVDLSTISREHGLDCKFVSNIKDEDAISYIREKSPDLIYCFGWSQLIPKEILKIPPLGVIGFHPAQLPQNRGRHPIIWALVLGLERTASTFFYITEGADEGDIISQVILSIDKEENANTLYHKIMEAANRQVKEFTNQFMKNEIIRIPQQNMQANYWRKRTKKDGEIDWRMGAVNICRLVRALTKPYIGAHFIYMEKEYKVWSARLSDNKCPPNIEYGKVLQVFSNTSFEIKAGDFSLIIEECDPIVLQEGDYLL